MPDATTHRDDDRTADDHRDTRSKPWRDRSALEHAWTQHETVAGVARHFEIDDSTARRWLDRHDLREPDSPGDRALNQHDVGSKPWHNPDTLETVWREHDTIAEVAEHFGVDSKTISRWLDRHGLRKRYESPRRRLLRTDPDALEGGEV